MHQKKFKLESKTKTKKKSFFTTLFPFLLHKSTPIMNETSFMVILEYSHEEDRVKGKIWFN